MHRCGPEVTDPCKFPPGPMEVENMRLNCMGAERALPDRGDLTEYCSNNFSNSD